MVRQKCKVSNTDNVAVIELGYGDVQVGSITNPIDKYAGIGFMNDEVNPIGTQFKTKGTTTDDSGLDAMLIFKNLESFEVFEEHLANAKKELIELLSGEANSL